MQKTTVIAKPPMPPVDEAAAGVSIGNERQGKELPGITLDLAKICVFETMTRLVSCRAPIVMGAALSNKCVTGFGYALRWNDAIRLAHGCAMNVDGYLTAQVAHYMSNFGDRKSPVLVWYSNLQNLIILHITSRRDVSAMPLEEGFDSHTHGYLHANAEPFMYYNGNGGIFRVYFKGNSVKGDGRLLYDMGMIPPFKLGDADDSIYDRVVRAPLEDGNIEYAPVPQERRAIIEWRGKNIILERAFCNLCFGDFFSPSDEF